MTRATASTEIGVGVGGGSNGSFTSLPRTAEMKVKAQLQHNYPARTLHACCVFLCMRLGGGNEMFSFTPYNDIDSGTCPRHGTGGRNRARMIRPKAQKSDFSSEIIIAVNDEARMKEM